MATLQHSSPDFEHIPYQDLDRGHVAVRTADLVLVSEPVGRARYSMAGRLAKRAIDVVGSLILLVVLAPVLALIAALIRLDSKGSPLFRQQRVGYLEEPFTIWKFRTMAVDNDDSEHRKFVTAMLRDRDPESSGGTGQTVFKLAEDPRITRIGAFLRRTSLDELPQLVNVLTGSMTFVGPRPSLFYELEEYGARHRLRAQSVPGITGLWQVQGRNQLHMQEALDLDATYVETCGLLGDLQILVRTVGVVARGSGY